MNPFRLYIYNIIKKIIPETSCFYLKILLLRACGVDIHSSARVCSSVKFLGNGSVKVAGDVWIGPDTKIYSSGEATIYIEENVDIGPCVKISSGTHEVLEGEKKIAGKGLTNDIRIGMGSWVGINSVILSGVVIGKRNLIAANSTVHKSTESNSLYCNDSIKKIRNI
jgi:acetyltransferase-like isoleucine patch superfamily enzyme